MKTEPKSIYIWSAIRMNNYTLQNLKLRLVWRRMRWWIGEGLEGDFSGVISLLRLGEVTRGYVKVAVSYPAREHGRLEGYYLVRPTG